MPGSCRLSWENGGALRNQDALVGAIVGALEDVLAPLPQKSHNTESEAAEPPLQDDVTNEGEDQ